MRFDSQQEITRASENHRIMRLLLCILVSTTSSGLLLPLTSSPQQLRTPFEYRWGISLTDEDRSNIVDLARLLSDKPIKKVIAQYMLPSSVPLISVLYEDEVIGTFVIDTRLEIYKKDPSHWKQGYLDSLILSRGNWGTKQDFLQRKVLRLFTVGDTKVALRYSDSLSYREVARLLKAIKDKAIVWEDRNWRHLQILLEEITWIEFSEATRLYKILAQPEVRPQNYIIDAQVDGDRMIIKHFSMGIP